VRSDAGRCLLVVDPNPTTPSQSAWWLAAQAAREDMPRPVFQLLSGHGRVWCKRSEAMRALAYVVSMPEWDECDFDPFQLR
jgi:hypothetical protein